MDENPYQSPHFRGPAHSGERDDRHRHDASLWPLVLIVPSTVGGALIVVMSLPIILAQSLHGIVGGVIIGGLGGAFAAKVCIRIVRRWLAIQPSTQD